MKRNALAVYRERSRSIAWCFTFYALLVTPGYQRYQQQLLATLIRWMNIILLIAVGLNTVWMLWDLWGTLFQNVIILVVVAID